MTTELQSKNNCKWWGRDTLIEQSSQEKVDEISVVRAVMLQVVSPKISSPDHLRLS